MSNPKSPRTDIPSSTPTSLKVLLRNNLYEFVRDVVIPLRVIIATFVVFVVFLIADQMLFWIFEILTQDIRLRSPFLALVFDGVEISSAIGVAVYFLISGLLNLRTQWRISQKIEKRAGLQ